MPNTRDLAKLLDWIATNAQMKAQAKQNFTNTDYAFKLYNQAHPYKRIIPQKSPSSLIFISQARSRKRLNSCFWAAGALALGYTAFGFLSTFPLVLSRWTPNLQRHTTAILQVLLRSKNYPRPPRSQKKLQKSGLSSRPPGRSTSLRCGTFID